MMDWSENTESSARIAPYQGGNEVAEAPSSYYGGEIPFEYLDDYPEGMGKYDVRSLYSDNNDSYEKEVREVRVENAADGARNMVQNAENAVENTALDVSNASRNMTENFENTMNNTMDFDNATINETTNTEADDMDTGYTATRTSTDLYDAGTTMGINNNAWIWIIIALATTAIVILAYSYATQNNYRDRNTDND